jgi:hypothetical protein
MVAGQKIALGRIHAHQVVTVHVAAETITVDLDDHDNRTVRRSTTQPVRPSRPPSPARLPVPPKPAPVHARRAPGDDVRVNSDELIAVDLTPGEQDLLAQIDSEVVDVKEVLAALVTERRSGDCFGGTLLVKWFCAPVPGITV